MYRNIGPLYISVYKWHLGAWLVRKGQEIPLFSVTFGRSA